MKSSHQLTNYILGALILLSLALSSPTIVPGLLAGTATTMLMIRSLPMHIGAMPATVRSSAANTHQWPSATLPTVQRVPLENGRGVVVFAQVNGKLTTRCFYNVAT